MSIPRVLWAASTVALLCSSRRCEAKRIPRGIVRQLRSFGRHEVVPYLLIQNNLRQNVRVEKDQHSQKEETAPPVHTVREAYVHKGAEAVSA